MLLGAVLAAIGAVGIVARRDDLGLLIGVPLMLAGATVTFLGGAVRHSQLGGVVAGILILVVAAAGIATGFAMASGRAGRDGAARAGGDEGTR